MVEIGAVRGADRRNLRFVGGGEREKMREFFSGGDVVIVTESFAHRYGTREGMCCESGLRRGWRGCGWRGCIMITRATGG